VTDTDCWLSSPKVSTTWLAKYVRARQAEQSSKICG
jgi:hypothetical protein